MTDKMHPKILGPVIMTIALLTMTYASATYATPGGASTYLHITHPTGRIGEYLPSGKPIFVNGSSTRPNVTKQTDCIVALKVNREKAIAVNPLGFNGSYSQWSQSIHPLKAGPNTIEAILNCFTMHNANDGVFSTLNFAKHLTRTFVVANATSAARAATHLPLFH